MQGWIDCAGVVGLFLLETLFNFDVLHLDLVMSCTRQV
jgi:hypothetical protein